MQLGTSIAVTPQSVSKLMTRTFYTSEYGNMQFATHKHSWVTTCVLEKLQLMIHSFRTVISCTYTSQGHKSS
jgi:hypothetical protein